MGIVVDSKEKAIKSLKKIDLWYMINKKDKEYCTNCGYRKDQDKKISHHFQRIFRLRKVKK